SGETFVSASEGTGSGTSFTDAVGAFAAGASRTVTIVAMISPSVADGSTLTDSATATSTTSDPNAGDNTATFDTTVATSADLAITKTESPNPGTVNNPITYTLVVHDNGPSDAQSVTVTDSLPAGVTFVSATSSQGTVGQSGGVVTGHLGALANAGTATI